MNLEFCRSYQPWRSKEDQAVMANSIAVIIFYHGTRKSAIALNSTRRAYRGVFGQQGAEEADHHPKR